MIKRAGSLALLTAVVLAAAFAPPAASAPQDVADTIFVNANVITMNDAQATR